MKKLLGDLPAKISGEKSGRIVGARTVTINDNLLKFIDTYFNVGLSPVQVLNYNRKRHYLLIQNNSPNLIYISFGKVSGLNGIQVTSGGNYEPYICPNSSVSIVAAGVNSGITIVEGYNEEM